jgi:hypothetical protein
MPTNDKPAMRGHSGLGVQLGGEPRNPTSNPGREQESGYPFTPGYRHQSTGETARAAALAVGTSAKTLEAWCLDALANGPRSPEEARAWIEGATGRPPLLTSIRPRFSALKARGLVADSSERGLGEGGRCKSIRWRLTTATERALFAASAAADAEHGEPSR